MQKRVVAYIDGVNLYHVLKNLGDERLKKEKRWSFFALMCHFLQKIVKNLTSCHFSRIILVD